MDEIGDTQGCKLIDGRVQMPEGYKQFYADYAEQVWRDARICEA